MTLSVITSYESKMNLLMNTDTGVIYLRDMEYTFKDRNFKFHIQLDMLHQTTDRIRKLDMLHQTTDRIRICDSDHNVIVSISSKSPIYLHDIFREICSYGLIDVIYSHVYDYIRFNKRTYTKYELMYSLDHLLRERFVYDFEIKCS